MIEEIWHGDCIELMKTIRDKSIDFILCDLPYGVSGCHWDNALPLHELWEAYERIIKDAGAIVLFATQPFTTDLINSHRDYFKYSLVWKKNVPTGMVHAKYRPMKYHEDIVVFYKNQPTYNPILKERIGKGKACYNYHHYCGDSNHIKLDKIKKKYDPNYVQPSTILEFNVVPNRNGKLHPTQKPIELLEYLIQTYTNENDLVLDNCAGSGSTLIAAKNLKRQFIGIEKELHYYTIINNRLNGKI